ncbi:helix-turn-helix domain-containing protein [Aquicella lusitana]|uniref:HTH-type transcriptional regulator/antitoxin HipB n=1 Tax=Aquicella lusitana TaxID=254246 RepID=A0A370GZF8_9COXI|nr:helix-turn-helix domain-containing protein [Aquicella lusitana]RDI48054.1 HTH-type transcriptional regulator/antitoxin HipB [Aquicella lusitana]VVC72929.1 Antitoxin HipB [Aquicella lusitana]
MLIRSPKELALLIVNQRKKLKLSQTEVSNLVGLKQKTISALENKPESTQLDTLFRVLSALNLDIQLLSKDEIPTTKWKEEW